MCTCIYKLLFAQHEIHWVEGILWYMYLYIIDSLFQAFKYDQHTHYTHKTWCDLFFRLPTCLHVYIEYLYLELYICTE